MRDIRYALRAFARSPGFTIAAILSLSLGIGSNLTIYTIANTFLNQPVRGVSDADRLARVYVRRHSPLQFRDLEAVRENAKSCSGVAGERMMPVAVANGTTT